MEKIKAIFSIAFVMIAVGMGSITPLYIGKIVDGMIKAVDKTPNAVHEIWTALVLFILLRFFSEIFRGIGNLLMYRIGTNLEYKINADLIYKVQRFSSHWHESNFAGATVRKITRTGSAVNDVCFTSVLVIVPACVVIIVTEMLLFKKLPYVAFAFLFAIILYVVASILISLKLVRPRFKIYIEKDTYFNAKLNDIIGSLSIIKSFAAENREDNNIGVAINEAQTHAFSAFKMVSYMNILRGILELGIYATVVSIAVFMWVNGVATPGDIALIISTASVVNGYLSGIGNSAANIQRNSSAMEEGIELWSREEEVQDKPHAVDLVVSNNHREDKIVYDKVTFQYPNTKHYLFGELSLKIAQGEKIALVGTSGSGKSSFIKLLQRMYNLQGGAIYIEGQNIADVTIKSLRRAISLVPQEPVLFHRSLKENISYGKPNATMDEIIEASKKAHIHEFIATLKDGYDTEVGERGLKLSGGERQRVAIARAILADRPILVLDEATSSLDSVSEYYVKEAMKELTKGKTTITVAHRLSTIKNSDRILVFDQGKIIEHGKHDELMKDPSSNYGKLYQMQSLGILINDDENKS